MSITKEAKDLVVIIKRLITFDLEDILDGARKIPPGVVDIQVKDRVKNGEDYRTIKVSLSNEKALKDLDLDNLKKVATPQVVKAASLLKRNMSFDPKVVCQAQNMVPHGMIEISVTSSASTGVANNNNNFNSNKRKKKDASSADSAVYWPDQFAEIEPV